MTGSPGAKPVAPGPIVSTQPAFSCPRVNGKVNDLAPAGSSSRWRSEWQAPAPPTLISTSPGPGSGTGTSRSCPGCCHSTNWKALISLPLFPVASLALAVLDPVELDLQVQRAPKHLVHPVGRRVDDQPRVLDAPQERLQCDVDLQACQWTADATVYSAAPTHVLVVRALDVELLGVGGSLGVAVGRAVQQVHRRASGDDDPADLDIGGDAAAGEELDGRLQPQNLFDRLRDQFGLLVQKLD